MYFHRNYFERLVVAVSQFMALVCAPQEKNREELSAEMDARAAALDKRQQDLDQREAELERKEKTVISRWAAGKGHC